MNKRLVMLCEGAVMVALSIALSYIDIPLGIQGGSINLTMIPIIVFALHYGAIEGVIAGLVFGTLKFFAGGSALNWESLLLDYSLAYGAIGIAGLFGKTKHDEVIGTFCGCFLRFAVHFISGITVYAEYAESTYFGINTANMYIYSFVYNAVYMIPSTVIALILVPSIMFALKKTKYYRNK